MERPVTPVSFCQTAVQPEAIKGQAEPFNAELIRILHQYLEHSWVQVQMQMAVHMVQEKSGRSKFLKLIMNFSPDLFRQRPLKVVSKSHFHWAVAELSGRVDQAGNGFWTQTRMAAKQGEV